MKMKQINKKKLFVKALEDGIKKASEITIIGLVIGLSLYTLFLTVAGVMSGSLIAKIIKLTLMEVA